MLAAFRTEDDDRSRERVLRKNLRCQGSKTVGTFTKIDRLHGQSNARTGRNLDHRRKAEARIARNTVVSVLPSMPDATRTTAPASSTVSGVPWPYGYLPRD